MRAKESFLHDSDARNDVKILELRAAFGWSGYGIYWALVEMMRSATNYRLQTQSTKAIALGLGSPEQDIRAVIDCCIKVELFAEEAGHFFAPSLMRRMEAFESRSSQATLAANKRWSKARDPGGGQCDSIASALRPQCLIKPKPKLEEGGESERGERVQLAPKILIASAEVEKLKEEFGAASVEYYAKVCSDWLISNGKTKKNYAAFIRNWIRKDIAERKGFYHASKFTANEPKRVHPPLFKAPREDRTPSEVKALLKTVTK